MLTDKPFSVIYLAKPEYIAELCAELGDVSQVIGNLVFSSQQKSDVCFALDIWLNPKIATFESISEAVRILRAEGKYWYLNPIANIRRSHLIASELRKLPELTHSFPLEKTLPEIGCFSLLDKNTLVYSAKRWKKPPLGNYHFIEDKKNPPNRAYLKLWEALTLLDHYPKQNELAIDLGASPGGWSYVMHTLGVRVIAVDKALLDPRIQRLSNLTFLQQSAFALDPKDFNHPIDWLLCDVACYPERLYTLVTKWLAADKVKQFIFTIKLQGQTNLEVIKKFQAIPGGRVIHLFNNKHEAIFFYPASKALIPEFVHFVL